MKALTVVVHDLNIGGTETHISRILPKLKAKGLDIELLVLAPPLTLAPLIEQASIPVHVAPQSSFKPLSILKRLVFLYKHIAKRPRAILHFFLPVPYILGMVAATFTGHPSPKVMSRRSLNTYQHKYPLIRFLEKILHKRANAILGNSQAILKELEWDEGVEPYKLHLIYNGIEPEAFMKAPKLKRSDLNLSDQSFVMAIAANLIPYKGHLDLLKACGIFDQNYQKPWDLVCIGEDRGILKELKAFITGTPLENKVHFLGKRKDLSDILPLMDLGVLASHEEGFSNAILEYMAAKLAVVATDVGGNGEAVIHGQTGLIVPSHAPQAIADAILDLANHPDKRESYGEAGRLRVLNTFSLKACVQQYIDFYENL